MKIDVNSLSANTLPIDRSPKQVSTGNLAATQSVTQDRTTFHSDTQSIQSLTSQAMKTPEIRQDKVDALSQSVKSGQYKPDANQTAGAILNQEG
jgi:flagellar biosynthesis anti-sigma factor FlgM